jgi:hypothetical protein
MIVFQHPTYFLQMAGKPLHLKIATRNNASGKDPIISLQISCINVALWNMYENSQPFISFPC